MFVVTYITQHAVAKECASPPSKINLLFDFDWPDASISGLARKLRLQCAEPENYFRLMQVVKLHLIREGVYLTDIKLHNDHINKTPQIDIDSVSGTSQKKSLIMPVHSSSELNDIIPVFTPKTAAVEGEEIVISYATDDMFIRSVGGFVNLQWLRDGAIVPNIKGARYKLRLEDVGRKISAVLRVTVDKRTIAYQVMQPTPTIKLAERPPKIKNLAILGNAVVGEEVRAKYQFLDMNPEDEEGATQFAWFRGNNAIENANYPTYVIVPADIGQIISVVVIPRSDDGNKGSSVVASMQDTVDEGLVKFTTEIIDGLVSPIEGDVELEETPEAMFEAVSGDLPQLRLPFEDRLAGRDVGKGPLVSAQYITLGMRLAPGSPTQFLGFRRNFSKLLSDEVFDQIAFEFIGRPIDTALLKDVVMRVNQAYVNAGFNLSRALLPEQTVDDGLIEIQLVEDADLHHHF